MNTDRLFSVISAAQRRGPHVEPKTQKELILYRIASGNGMPVSLPEIQQGAWGTFVSDPQARIHELRKLFFIDSEWHIVNGQKHSTYLLRLNPDGTPQLKNQDVAPKRATLTQVYKPMPPQSQMQSTFNLLYETGRVRG